FLLTFPDCRRECAQAVRRIPSLIFLLPLLLSVVWLGPSCTVPPTWIAQTQHGGIAYFLFASGSLRRFVLAAEAWLDPIQLSDVPTAFTVDDDGLYVAFDRRVSRITFDGATEFPLENTATSIQAVATDGHLLFVTTQDGTILTVDKHSGLLLASSSHWYGMVGLSVSSEAQRLFGRSLRGAPSDIVYAQYASDGSITATGDSPYHGNLPTATRTWVLPDGEHVVDGGGTIYRVSDLRFVGSLGRDIEDLALLAGLPIVLRGN